MKYKVITLWQPWATLWACGEKEIETRPAPTSWTVEKGIYLIHAACKFDLELARLCRTEPFKSALKRHGYWVSIGIEGKREKVLTNLPIGAIVGSVQIESCHSIFINSNGPFICEFTKTGYYKNYITDQEASFGDYREGRYAWKGINHRHFSEPIKYKNGQGYYKPFRGTQEQLNFILIENL
jgi:hypothetical protein